MLTIPRPSALDGRDSRRITWRCLGRSSAVSSTVMMRSVRGMKLESTSSMVVFPEVPPPATTMFIRAWTQALRNSTIAAVSVPFAINWSTESGLRRSFRIVKAGPLTARGGMMTLIREPSGRRASHIGEFSSTRRPVPMTMR